MSMRLASWLTEAGAAGVQPASANVSMQVKSEFFIGFNLLRR
jgi:hypothetical protein